MCSYVKFTILGNQVPDFAINCPNGGFDGCQFTDLTELAGLRHWPLPDAGTTAHRRPTPRGRPPVSCPRSGDVGQPQENWWP